MTDYAKEIRDAYRFSDDGDSNHALACQFDVAEWLNFHGFDVPAEWDFCPSPLRGEDFPPEFGGFGLCLGLDTGLVDPQMVDPLRDFGDVLRRIHSKRETAGMTY